MQTVPIVTKPKCQQGLSIVEILVVIIILLFGILSIVKIYPSGFLVMRNSANLNRADRIESGMLASLIAGNNIPAGVYYPSGYSVATGQTFNLTTDPTNPDNLNQGGTYISQQPFTVPAPTTANPDPLVVLPFGPISYSSPTVSAIGADGITVASSNWKPIQAVSTVNIYAVPVISSNAEAALLTDGQYAVDTTDSKDGYDIVFPVESYNQTFYVNYTVGGQIMPAIQLTLPSTPSGTIDYTNPTIAANPTYFNPVSAYGGYWDTLANLVAEYGGGGGPTYWDPGSLQISRPLVAVTGSAFTADPYEYQVDTNADIQNGSINLGVLQFSPKASPNLLGHQLKVLVSYSVYNWGILHDDQVLTGSSDLADLSVTDIRGPGAIYTLNGSLTPFQTLFPTDTASNYPIVALDLNTGNTLTEAQFLAAGYSIDYVKGHIPLLSNFGAAHPHVRFFFETADDLALALQQAPSQYQPIAQPGQGSSADNTAVAQLASTTSTIPNAYFHDYSWNDGIDADQILFPATYVGQVVTLENVTWMSFAGKTYPLGNLTVNISPTTENVNGYNVAYTDITSDLSNAATVESAALGITINLASPGTTGAFNIGSIGSSSAQAVCIWHEFGKWKKHSVSTVLN